MTPGIDLLDPLRKVLARSTLDLDHRDCATLTSLRICLTLHITLNAPFLNGISFESPKVYK